MRTDPVLALLTIAVCLAATVCLGQTPSPPSGLSATTIQQWELANQGGVAAQAYLGYAYQTGTGAPKDDFEAAKWYRKAAEQGNVLAQHNLGVMFRSGQGVTQSDAEAVRWYRTAATLGYVLSQYNLGMLYQNGQGVDQNVAEAAKWYRKAAEQGNVQALGCLQTMAEQGNADALENLIAMASAGNAGAQYKLGLIYHNGTGVPWNDSEAVRWYRKAAEQGCADAQNNLGAIYQMGVGVKQDDAEAAKWYRKAAERSDHGLNNLTAMAEYGNADAQAYLGEMYQHGRGVSKDDAEAIAWYRKAAAQGSTTAQKQLDEMTATMNAAAQKKGRASASFVAPESPVDSPMLTSKGVSIVDYVADNEPVSTPAPKWEDSQPVPKWEDSQPDESASDAKTAKPSSIPTPSGANAMNVGYVVIALVIAIPVLLVGIQLLMVPSRNRKRTTAPNLSSPSTGRAAGKSPGIHPIIRWSIFVVCVIVSLVVSAAWKVWNEQNSVGFLGGLLRGAVCFGGIYALWLWARKSPGDTGKKQTMPRDQVKDHVLPATIATSNSGKKERPAMDPAKKSVLVAVAAFALLMVFFMPYRVTETGRGANAHLQSTRVKTCFVFDTPATTDTRFITRYRTGIVAVEISGPHVLLYLLISAALGASVWALSGRRKKNSVSKEVKAALGALDEASCRFETDAFQMVEQIVRKSLSANPDAFLRAIRDSNGRTPREWVYSQIGNAAGDLLESGNYHIYRGVLSPTGPGEELLKIFDATYDELLRMEAVTSEYASKQKAALRESIKGMG